MYHRHHSWQHELYPTDPWPEFADALPAPPPSSPAGPYPHHDLLAPRLALAGSLDPATGIFYRSPEHPRLRTAQACEKCRTRKAKCSGEHPTCKRCATRGLVCEYAKEGRVRGPNKPKAKKEQELSTAAEMQHEGRAIVRPRPSNLRLDRTRPAPPPSSFGDLYPSSADSPPQFGGRRSSCSLSESGGSLPSSAVSSTFELPPPAHFSATADYPPSTQIHQLTHEHQQRLLAPSAMAAPATSTTERHVVAHIPHPAPLPHDADFDRSYTHHHLQQQHYVPVQHELDYHSCQWPTPHQVHFTDTQARTQTAPSSYTYDAPCAYTEHQFCP